MKQEPLLFECDNEEKSIACINGRFNVATAFGLEKSGIELGPKGGKPISGYVEEDGRTDAEALQDLLDMEPPIQVVGKSAGAPVNLQFVFEKAQDKANTTIEEIFSVRPSLARIRQLIEKYHVELRRKEYVLKTGRLHITEESWPTLKLTPPRNSKWFTIAVVVVSKAFSSVKPQEGLSMLGVAGPTPAAEATFAADVLSDDEELPADMLHRTQFKTVHDVLLHLANDMARRAYISRSSDKEAGKRELVSPFLMAAATIVPEIQVRAEFNVEGARAHGFVDWAVLFRMFCIIIVEAELNTPFTQYLGQLAAEMVSAREDYAITSLGKRVHEATAALPQVPSYGIVTNGQNMQFYKYCTSSTGDKVLLQSDMVQVFIDQNTTWQEALAAVKPIVGRLVHILRAQVSELSNCAELKKPRLEE